jgi:hypothetical protein
MREAMNNIMQGNEGCVSEGDIVPETQVIASSQEHILHMVIKSSQKNLDFEDYMVQFEHGPRKRYRNSTPSLHVNSTPQTHTTLDGNLRGEKERNEGE